MANPHKGEVSFEAGGRRYTLRFSIDAICRIEEATGRGIVALTDELADPQQLRMSIIRQMLFAGLREHHPEMTLIAAGDLIEEVGGLLAVIEHVGDALSKAFPEPASKEGNGVGNPRGPSHGIGSASLPTG